MKKLLAAALLAFCFSVANAQYGPRYDHRAPRQAPAISQRTMDIEYLQRDARREIDRAMERGTLNRREAHVLIKRYEQIELRQRRYSHRGRLSAKEARVLRNDLERLMADTRHMSRRGDQWAREPRRRY